MRPAISTWPRWVVWSIALLVLLPLAVIFSSFGDPQREVWAHLNEFVLPRLLVNTFWLLLGVGTLCTVLGVSLAWLTAVCEFPGRRWFSWALLLPLAVPGYVLGFIMIGLLDFTGPLQTGLRASLGWAPEIPIRSRAGVIAVMGLTLYPYVYLVARNAFMTQGRRALEAAQTLGLSRRRGFFKVALPMARPWIAGGLALVLMETLADFGTVAVFNYDTFTTAIYKAWFGLFNLSAASQLASLLVLWVLLALGLEQGARSRQRFHAGARAVAAERIVLGPLARWGASAWCLAVLVIAFLLPFVQLLAWAWQSRGDLDPRYLQFLGHSLLLSVAAALIVVLLALLLVYALRLKSGPGLVLLGRFATLGYALPGAVLAVGFYLPVAWVDRQWLRLADWLAFESATPLLGGTLVTMLLAYAVRFLAVGVHPLEAGLQRVTRSMDEAARSLGHGAGATLRRVHLPLLRGGLATAATLVFVDVMKEMPITLMTRPFGWDTLAVRVFEMTSEGEWQRAALPAVALVLAGLIPVLLMTRAGDKG